MTLHAARSSDIRSVTHSAILGIANTIIVIKKIPRGLIARRYTLFNSLIFPFLSKSFIDIEDESRLSRLSETIVQTHVYVFLELPTVAHAEVG